MKRKKNKKLKIFLYIYIILFIISLSLYLYFNIFKPSYYSMISDCIENSDEILDDAGFFVVGQTGIKDNNISVSNATINIYIFKPEDYITLFENSTKTLRHEFCHYHQILENRELSSCESLTKVYLIEMECYIKQQLPLYNKEIRDYVKRNNITLSNS